MDNRLLHVIANRMNRAESRTDARAVLWFYVWRDRRLLEHFRANRKNMYRFLRKAYRWHFEAAQMIILRDPSLASFVINADGTKLNFLRPFWIFARNWRQLPQWERQRRYITYPTWTLLLQTAIQRGELTLNKRKIILINSCTKERTLQLLMSMADLTWEIALEQYTRFPKMLRYLCPVVHAIPLSKFVTYACTSGSSFNDNITQLITGFNYERYLALLVRKYAQLPKIKSSIFSKTIMYNRLFEAITAEVRRGTSVQRANHDRKLLLHALIGDIAYGDRRVSTLLRANGLRVDVADQQRILANLVPQL